MIVKGIIAQLYDRIRRFNLQGLNTSELTKYKNRLKEVRSAMNYKTGSGIMTNISDLIERVKLIIGSIEAGNSNKMLKNELSDILYYLYKNRKINKNTYDSLINLTI